MGGGILLLATMFIFLPHGQAVPLHAAVQMVSNGSRVVIFWEHVHWRTVAQFSVGLAPGAVAAGAILWALGEPGHTEPYLKILVGLYVLILTFLPPPKSSAGPARRHGFAILGLLAGTASITVGAVGPLIAPLFARRNFIKERLIATKAVCQVLTHILKIPTFWLLGTIVFAEFSRLLVPMAVVAVAGTLLGKRILQHVSQVWFVRLYRVAMTVAGTKVLLFDGLAKLVGAE